MTKGADTPVAVRAYLALGSNIGDKIEHLRAAVAAIGTLPQTRILARSAIYRTPPWGKTDQDWFANAVIAVETTLSPRALLDACLAIEIEQGRIRLERWGPRVIDIDVLIHGETRMATDHLTLPHPAMQERAFVLIPLMEIAPGLTLEGKSIAERIASLDSTGIAPIAPL